MAEYTRWYRVGTAALTKNSKIVTGTGTFWLAAGLNPGDLFTVDASQFYEVDAVSSNTQLTLKTAYAGDSTTETEYSIVRNFTASLPAQVAAQTADLLNDFRQFVDLKMQSIHGKNAYQIACDKGFVGTESEWIASLEGATAYEIAVKNGYTGTESEWLESLKAAQEWTQTHEVLTDTDKLADSLGVSRTSLKNLLFSGKNLGEFTAEHAAQIKNGTFTGLGLGDYWTHNGKKYRIAGFNYFYRNTWKVWSSKSIAVWRDDPLQWDEFDFPLMTSGDITYNINAVGEEGEEGYMPSTYDQPYPTSNWYVNIRPKFLEMVESIFTGDDLPTELSWIRIEVPAVAKSQAAGAASVTLEEKVFLPTIGMCQEWNLIHPRLGDGYTGRWGGHGYPTFGVLPLFRARPELLKTHNFAMAETLTNSTSNGASNVAYTDGLTNQAIWGSTFSHMKLKPIFCLYCS